MLHVVANGMEVFLLESHLFMGHYVNTIIIQFQANIEDRDEGRFVYVLTDMSIQYQQVNKQQCLGIGYDYLHFRNIKIMNNMKSRFMFVTALLLTCVVGLAQNVSTGCVVDADSGEPLPFATIYVSENYGGMCNAEGEFRIEVPAGNGNGNVTVRCMGYESLTLPVSQLNGIVRLSPSATTLREVEVAGISAEEIINKVVKRLKQEYKESRKETNTYFTRTMQMIDGRKEMTEAFVEGKSAMNIRGLAVLTGRRYSVKNGVADNSNLKITNLHHYFELGPKMKDSEFWNPVVRPLEVNSVRMMYDIKLSDIYDKPGGKTYYCLDLKRKAGTYGKNLMEGKMYVDKNTFLLESFDGILPATSILVADNYECGIAMDQENRPVDSKFVVHYRHDRGFTEVESVRASSEGRGVRTSSLMFNVCGDSLPKMKARGIYGNLQASVDRAKRNGGVWAMPEVVKRTREENELFETVAAADSAKPMKAFDFGDFAEVAARQAAFGKTIPQEKVYVHLDNTSYCLGDTIWFAAYLRQTTDDKPSRASGVLYVELLDNDGYLVERKVTEMAGGSGNGFFALNKDIQYAGYYELRAYTRWQLNWGVFERRHSSASKGWFVNDRSEKLFYKDYEKLYSRVFPVYDTPHEDGIFSRDMTLRPLRRYYKSDETKRTLTVDFYPEGGSLVYGTDCRMAFEAAWNDGEWADGYLVHEGDTVHTANRGRSMMTIHPEQGFCRDALFVSTDGSALKCTIPEPERNGVAISVIRETGGWKISAVVCGNVAADSLAVVVTHEGKTQKFAPLGSGCSSVSIASDDLTAGVNQATVFDKQGRVYADRLFFVTGKGTSAPTLSVYGIKEEYQPCESIRLHIRSTAKRAAPLSVSVRDMTNCDFTYDNADIMTEMLLSSEIRGFVPDAKWYFARDDEERRTALDLLMMTQGWRRFNWRDMAVQGAWELTEPSEPTPVIRGYVTDVPSWDYAWNNAIGDVVGKERTRQDNLLKTDNNRHRRPWEETLKKSDGVLLHAEIGQYGDSSFLQETELKSSAFTIRLPRIYGPCVLFLSASDTTKWKGNKKYEWVQAAPDYETGARISPREYNIRIAHPYPRFVKPYTFYHKSLMENAACPQGFPFADTMPGTTLKGVTIRARRNGLRRFDDSYPACVYDAYSAFSDAFDAGFVNLYVNTDINGQKNVARNIVNDMGVSDPHHNSMRMDAGGQPLGGQYSWTDPLNVKETDPSKELESDGETRDYISIRFGLSPTARALPQYIDIPQDSLYLPKYLSSKSVKNVGDTNSDSDEAFVSPGERMEFNNIAKLDKYFLYTDYSPRRSGSARYQGNDVTVQLAVYPFYDGARRMIYRDRCLVLPGFSYPAEFYSPDYSKHKLPEDRKDYRRTLYWNPNLMLDSNGEARVTLYNNSRTTSIHVDVQGQSPDGTLLWNE